MLRLILLVIVGMFVAVGVLAVALFHFWGWKGLVAFPFIILALLWFAKFAIKSLAKKFALSLFGMKARALRGATMNIHFFRYRCQRRKTLHERHTRRRTADCLSAAWRAGQC